MKKKKKTVSKPAVKKVSDKKVIGKSHVSKPANRTEDVNETGVYPLGDRVLVRPSSIDEVEATTSFGIIIPDSAKEKPEQGTVVAVGPGKPGDDNELIPLSVCVGDKVMFSKYGYDTVKVAGVEYYILSESSILAILK